jgi:CRISPR-associated exonuclease Cas4
MSDAADETALEIPISAIEHFSYCPRQCALIHIEQTFDENVFTIRGALSHERVHSGVEGDNRGVRTLRSIPLWSSRLDLIGQADAVEMRPEGPYPVEYKVGRPHGVHAALQLCAQALCLEEMLGVPVPGGAIYYFGLKRREEVVFDAFLRDWTERAIEGVADLLRFQTLPMAVNDGRCPDCSLKLACLPAVVADAARLRGLQGALFKVWDAEGVE